MAYLQRNISFHISEDRLDRAVFIATKIGYGNVVHEKFYVTEDRGCYWRQVTDTGVLFVLNEDKTRLITLWLAKVNQAVEVFDGAKLPQYLYKKIMKNQQYQQFM